jgi:succinate dehydrogenase/fumarate reductase flavoprotein subunit
MTADVVVVGFGGAGSAAAITAGDLGADVVVVEKQPEAGHTPSTMMLGGGLMAVTDVTAGTRYLDLCAGGRVPLAVSQAWARKASDLAGWAQSTLDGVRIGQLFRSAEHRDFAGSDAIASARLYGSRDGRALSGVGLFAALSDAVRRRNITVRWSARGEKLLGSKDRVEGLLVRHSTGGLEEIRARHGVILCTGGFGASEWMKREFLPGGPCYFYGNPASTGDGIVLAQAVGARLWHMNQMMGRGVGHFQLGSGAAVDLLMLLSPLGGSSGAQQSGYVITDRHGKRYADESGQAGLGHGFYAHMLSYDPGRLCYPRIPSYWFFDERRRRSGPLTPLDSGAVGVGICTWSSDNLAEISRGWIRTGRSIEEAAAQAGIDDPLSASRTVSAYNQACTAGRDQFGRPPESLIPLNEPPYYCVPLWPGGTNTSGGPERDDLGRVIDVYGQPIAGLYSAGELGQAMGPAYPGAFAYYSEVLCSGRIAGENAVRSALGCP